MITGRHIVVLSSVDWDDLWQGQHELASRLARAGNRVLYVDNMGVRSPQLTDAARVASRLDNWLRSRRRHGAREVAPNLYVSSPLVLPPFGSRWGRAVNRILLLPVVRRVAARLGMRDPVLWSYLPTDTVLELIGLLRTPRSMVIYSCVADLAELTPHPRQLLKAEEALIESSDLVFAQGPRLFEHCARWSRQVHQVECSVSLESFSPPDDGSVGDSPFASGDGTERVPLTGLQRPIIGYIGGLHRHLNLGLAVELARARPASSWVNLGPTEAPVGQLAALPNVHLTGRVPHPDVSRYIGGFDVCTVPYKLGPETDTVFPTKLVEYLAMGKPVVSTMLPEVRQFNAQHRVVALAPARPAAFLRAIDEALASTGDGDTEARRQAAASRDWETHLERMSDLLESSAPAEA